jgi:hypothetical protein
LLFSYEGISDDKNMKLENKGSNNVFFATAKIGRTEFPVF